MTILDELEEQVAAARHDGEVADLVHDQELGPAQEAQPLARRERLGLLTPVRAPLGELGGDVRIRLVRPAAPRAGICPGQPWAGLPWQQG